MCDEQGLLAGKGGRSYVHTEYGAVDSDPVREIGPIGDSLSTECQQFFPLSHGRRGRRDSLPGRCQSRA